MNGTAKRLAIVLAGGGAKAAYQIGVMRTIARLFPGTRFDIITGVSAGAINALFLASKGDTLSEAVDELATLWENLRVEDVFRVDAASRLQRSNAEQKGSAPDFCQTANRCSGSTARRVPGPALPFRGRGITLRASGAPSPRTDERLRRAHDLVLGRASPER